ncbi:hypothetical protein MABM_35370 [Mycobacteroides abscessus]|nr:hypothetical protein MABM_35370 [Mycobacteroides abscessus]
MERHYVRGELALSHFVALLSAIFPEGEEFFIRSVRHYSDQVTNPALKKQVAGFIGQEKTHGLEHRELNERLQQMGYPTRLVDHTLHRALNFLTRHRSPRKALAVTAALEHYTAVLAETLLTDETAQELLGDNEVRSLLLWHALEESEHRAVAFDVYRTIGGTERERIRTMRLTTLVFLMVATLGTLMSLSQDRTAYHPVRLYKSLAVLLHSPFFSKTVIRRIRDYTQPGFHPNDHDNTALVEHWNTELFGEHGLLADHLH